MVRKLTEKDSQDDFTDRVRGTKVRKIISWPARVIRQKKPSSNAKQKAIRSYEETYRLNRSKSSLYDLILKNSQE